ncbi:MAG: glutamate--tRNA ligase [Acidimicrobiales bacterium]|nr:glutamate--tRNA ligase [Acidimicrobiales bacterium]
MPRVRFAPAPTGSLHVGSARSALFNWLYARAVGGTMVLRIEDTDTERNKPELIDGILRSLEWLGMDWDEGPIHQSDRFELYREAASKLLADGKAYLVDADDQEVEGTTLTAGLAARFRVPDEGAIEFDDVIRGHVRFENENVEDPVIWRSNGTPTFLIANAVDDVDLDITHVIRGEDLLSSTPKVIHLRMALGTSVLPVYAHLPLLVNAQRQKLSKRRDDVALWDYRDKGYLPEAMANYLALLGWGPPDGVEVRPMAEIIERFRLEDITKSAAFFDLKKLDHVNGEWMRGLAVDDFVERCGPVLAEGPWPADAFDASEFAAIAPLVQERVTTLADVPGYVDWLFLPEAPIDEASWEKAMVKGPEAVGMLDDAIAAFAEAEWTAEALHACLLALGEARGLKLGKAQAPVRVAVTGRTVGPPLFESLELLGRERTLERLRAARSRL